MGAAFLFIGHVALAETAPASNITIQGKTFYKDGNPWLPKGIQVEAFNRPATIPSAASGMNQAAAKARSYWGAAEINAIKKVFGADTVRFQISQPALDPQSPIYDPNYLAELLTVFKQARDAGFVVIVSMDAQAENGLPNIACMPDDSTVRAWTTLTPKLISDHGVMFEPFNEPCRASWKDAQAEWARGMQSVVDAIRGLGASNILLLDGLEFAQSVNGLFPLLHDRLPNRLAMATHPYVNSLKGVDLNNLDRYFAGRFGATAAQYPLIATEWNATTTNGCVGDVTPRIAMALVRYIQSAHIGLIGWAIDSEYGKMVRDHTSYEPTDYTTFSGCTKTPSISGAGKLIANFPNN